jgi:hypothetical protein
MAQTTRIPAHSRLASRKAASCERSHRKEVVSRVDIGALLHSKNAGVQLHCGTNETKRNCGQPRGRFAAMRRIETTLEQLILMKRC